MIRMKKISYQMRNKDLETENEVRKKLEYLRSVLGGEKAESIKRDRGNEI